MKDIIKYFDLSFEEFLSDDFFVRSNLYPTEESDLFWKKFEQENEGNLEDYFMARRSIHELNRDLLDEHSVATIWDRIRAANKSFKLRKYYRIGWAAAASIAVILMFRIFAPPKESSSHQDIMSFANRNITVTDSTTTQLILSENKIVSLPEKESVIVYDSVSIKTVSQEIAKNETAAFHQLKVPKGKRLFLTLSDGTQIWVNSGTKLIYPVEFDPKKREIYVDGEVYLDVATKSDQSFVVRTNDMDVEVMGTQFNVEAYGSDMQQRVVLKSGSVRIHSGINEDTVLEPNEMFEKTGEQETVTQVDVAQYISWVEGVYIYDNERLDAILTRLSRHYGQTITVDKAVSGLKCSGILDLKENLEEVLKVIAFVAPIHYTCQNNTYIITQNRKP